MFIFIYMICDQQFYFFSPLLITSKKGEKKVPIIGLAVLIIEEYTGTDPKVVFFFAHGSIISRIGGATAIIGPPLLLPIVANHYPYCRLPQPMVLFILSLGLLFLLFNGGFGHFWTGPPMSYPQPLVATPTTTSHHVWRNNLLLFLIIKIGLKKPLLATTLSSPEHFEKLLGIFFKATTRNHC